MLKLGSCLCAFESSHESPLVPASSPAPFRGPLAIPCLALGYLASFVGTVSLMALQDRTLGQPQLLFHSGQEGGIHSSAIALPESFFSVLHQITGPSYLCGVWVWILKVTPSVSTVGLSHGGNGAPVPNTLWSSDFHEYVLKSHSKFSSQLEPEQSLAR